MGNMLKSALICVVLLSVGLAPVAGVQATESRKARPVAQKSKAVMPVAEKKSTAAKKKSTTAKKKSTTAKKKSATAAKKVASKKIAQKKKVAKPVLSSPIAETGPLAVQSGAALVIDQNGEALFQKNASTVTPIASITKLMTAMVVIDSAPNLQAPITITDEDVDYLRGSRSRLAVGSVLTRENALLLALMSSENRAANALARHYPGGIPALLAAMNIKAQALGMRDTRFEDPTGLNSNNVSTANDLAKMVAAAYRYPLIREFSTTSDATVDVGRRELAYHNTNPLVKNTNWDVGLSKTGYINEAGKCLVMQARVADKALYIVLLDSVGRLTRVGDANRIKRWLESAQASHKLPTHAATQPQDNNRNPG